MRNRSFLGRLGAAARKGQRVARQNFQLLKRNPAHPSLRFKKVGDFWSARAGLQHRALAVADGEDYIWVWIGSHDEYKRFVKRGA